MFIFAPKVVWAFQSNDQNVIDVGATILRCHLTTLPLSVTIVLANMMYQTIGRVGEATFLAMARQGIFFIPAVLILPLIFGVWGVYLAQCASDVLAFSCAVPLSIVQFKRMKV